MIKKKLKSEKLINYTIEEFTYKSGDLKLFQEKIVHFFKSDSFENPNSLKVAEISNDPPMNIIEAKISDNQIRFEGIDVEAPQHLSKLTEEGLKIGLRSS